MRSLLQAQSQIKMLEVVTAGDRAVAGVTEFKPDVVIVDALLQGRTSGQQVAEAIRRAEPQIAIIVLTVPQNPVHEDAARGVDAVLKMPFSGFDLTTIVRQTFEARSVESSREGSLVVSLFSPKGGVGRTTLAYNLAVALGASTRSASSTARCSSRDLRGLLRVPATAPSIVNLPTDRIRESDVDEVVWHDAAGIDVMLAPPRVEMAEMVTVRDVEKALSILRQLYEFVVIDTRAALSDDVLVFLDASDLILQVLTYDAMAIRGLAMAGEAFDAIGYPPSKLATVLNRADAAGGFSKADVEEALGRPIDYEIVSDGRLVLAANNEGVPFVTSSPDAPISVGHPAHGRLARASIFASAARRSPGADPVGERPRGRPARHRRLRFRRRRPDRPLRAAPPPPLRVHRLPGRQRTDARTARAPADEVRRFTAGGRPLAAGARTSSCWSWPATPPPRRRLMQVRDASPVPVLGVVRPGAVAAAASTRVGHVGVIATAGTVGPAPTPRAIEEADPRVAVSAAGLPGPGPAGGGRADRRRRRHAAAVRGYLGTLLAA